MSQGPYDAVWHRPQLAPASYPFSFHADTSAIGQAQAQPAQGMLPSNSGMLPDAPQYDLSLAYQVSSSFNRAAYANPAMLADRIAAWSLTGLSGGFRFQKYSSLISRMLKGKLQYDLSLAYQVSASFNRASFSSCCPSLR